ncbi:uncharacterized protein H6S33_008012 [Morchella sextelata]|uniref:uncharacterized protein n=1 Tax=Morchella sextelata TaxID=1174677 RepID=UPI001D03CCF5|nr:uncharacterized protein H6S33_008012 [Morchella sextelata]KAH0603008.1 hypothetical protein H6S33_008012 [Morchella sextelata]
MEQDAQLSVPGDAPAPPASPPPASTLLLQDHFAGGYSSPSVQKDRTYLKVVWSLQRRGLENSEFEGRRCLVGLYGCGFG